MRVLVSFLGPVTEEEVRRRLPGITILKVFPDLGQALVNVPADFDLNQIRSQSGIIGADPEQEFQLFTPKKNFNHLKQEERLRPRIQTIVPGFKESSKIQPETAVEALGLNDVLNDIQAPQAWRQFNRGEGAVIAIVDSGVCGEFFPEEKRAGGIDTTNEGDPWSDGLGHGSMVATIAAGDSENGNPFDGVAPKAKIFSAKIFNTEGQTTTSNILEAVQEVISFASESQLPVAVNNSWGLARCSESPLVQCGGVSVSKAFRTATNQGVPISFAAGNEAERCGRQECTETTIWLTNSLDEVLSVATLDENGQVRNYSSRGPGQCSVINQKPDVAAPTYGTTVWNCETRNFTRGWGTSGASPIVTGILALLLTERPSLTTKTYHDAVRRSAGKDWNGCTGHGMVNAPAALIEVGGNPVPEGAISPSIAAGAFIGLGLLITGIEEE